MASEDHDFQEVNHINLFGKKVEWVSKQTGPVGRMCLNGFKEIIDELRLILGSSEHANILISIFENSYLKQSNLADSTRYLLNELFGKYGLVILDGDDKHLKEQFLPIIKKDILQNGFVDSITDSGKQLVIN